MARRRHAPLIGISCETIAKRKGYADYDLVCDHRYAMAIENGGGHPVLLTLAHKKLALKRYLEGIDGLLIVGGDDVDPSLYGEEPRAKTHVIYHRRTAFETWLYQAGKRRRLPIFGICYGMQLINVLEGGTLYQHLHPKRKGPRIDHRGRRRRRHNVQLMPGTRLAEIIGSRDVTVISEHHQAIRYLAPGFIPSCVADDGIIEGIENPERPEILAVQWHPERMPYSRVSRELFKDFVESCADYRRSHGGGV
jgi:putative glutamine amidotransferase